MSFRELRDLAEYMRVLGYPRLVSVDNFRTPNFGLVADILFWMVHRYDPAAPLSDDISTEDCRVDFLTTVAQVMYTKSGVKLNTKRLYSADGKAVKELLKVANLLYAAHRANANGSPEGAGGEELEGEAYGQVQNKLPDVKATRKLASVITESGAKLFDLLHDERDIAAERVRCLRFLDSISGNLDSSAEHKRLEKRLQELVSEACDNVTALEKQCEDLASDEKTLQVKIQKKQGELERNDKRLKSLQNVRPAFMDEYEKLEAELARQYEVYIEKFRNLDYLEHRLEAFNSKEREKLEASERARKRIQMTVMEKKARDLRGDADEHLFNGDDEEDEDDDVVGGSSKSSSNQDAFDAAPHRSNGEGRQRPEAGRSKMVSDGESDISAESDSDLSDSSSLSENDQDLINDDDDASDDDGSASGSSSGSFSGSEEDGDVVGSRSNGSDEESDDNF
mmetsp:Transcript_19918/g.50355  ORF Transcript_19918/g.50355 Transcript_19918/m.50355 type:complete len:452 (+) Transcript_19918:268-1623(+)|eukprot:CAMPEP_0202035500 /NCGR_PEP_ID=MMETSP0962-20130828/914_1 /ASSEMBLY_ACC=CAM_ASM_000488 /TAXON_ID=4773 /ORGANISM="Schizochytrium aggregatum, Strain ATCC28209" /LENGTH=451 /DNA_ID=CAMNT_0048599513 /DNA_START=258 /DNA_END=1613 /DNA_ORIENTATION=-